MTKNVTQLHLFVKLGNALAHVFEISVRKGGDGKANAYPSGEGFFQRIYPLTG